MNIIDDLRAEADAWLEGGEGAIANMLLIFADRLEASGALVPVPEGKPCLLRKCCTPHGVYKGRIFGHGAHCIDTSVHTAERPGLDDYLQPVRLVPLAEWEGDV